MEDILVPAMFFIALPWLIFHYVTKWKTAATITTDDEALLDDLYQLAKRLDERMDTVERLVSADHPDFENTRLLPNREKQDQPLRELERMMAEKKGESR
uniref:envelope stress response membrane protein PspB n=1 Tax=Parerythrobacter lutipelagi TaxID=1964208 RepID=UPI003B8346CD